MNKKLFIQLLTIILIIYLKKCESTDTENQTETENVTETDTEINTALDDDVLSTEEDYLSEVIEQDSDPAYLPEGYQIFPGTNIAYKIYNENLTWEEARERCIYDAADLATIDTWAKIKYIRSIDSSEESMMHVGFEKPENYNQWLRVEDDLPIAWMPWYKKHPPSDSRYCVVLLPGNYGLYNVGCWLKAKSVCQFRTSSTVTAGNDSPLIEPDIVISNGYRRFPHLGVAYRIYDDYKTHEEARDTCLTDNGQLALIDSFEKVKAIASLPKTGSLHVGIRVGSENSENWVADLNGKFLNDLPWSSDKSQLTKCAALRNDDSGLDETLCSNRLQFVCEIIT